MPLLIPTISQPPRPPRLNPLLWRTRTPEPLSETHSDNDEETSSHESTSTPHNLHLLSPEEEELTEDLSNQFSVATVLPRVPTLPSPTPIAQTGNLFPSLPFHPPPPPTPAMTSVKPTELRLNTPKAYNGSPITAKYWLNSVRTYLLINKDVYSTDDKKVGYTLSFMTEGTAKSRAAVRTQTALDASSFGTFPNFIADFKTTFQSTNSATEATTWLTNTRVRNDDYLPKYMGEFKLKVVEAELDSTAHAATIIHYLHAGIPVWLSDRIYGMEVIPTTPKGWYEKIDQFLSQ